MVISYCKNQQPDSIITYLCRSEYSNGCTNLLSFHVFRYQSITIFEYLLNLSYDCFICNCPIHIKLPTLCFWKDQDLSIPCSGVLFCSLYWLPCVFSNLIIRHETCLFDFVSVLIMGISFERGLRRMSAYGRHPDISTSLYFYVALRLWPVRAGPICNVTSGTTPNLLALTSMFTSKYTSKRHFCGSKQTVRHRYGIIPSKNRKRK